MEKSLISAALPNRKMDNMNVQFKVAKMGN